MGLRHGSARRKSAQEAVQCGPSRELQSCSDSIGWQGGEGSLLVHCLQDRKQKCHLCLHCPAEDQAATPEVDISRSRYHSRCGRCGRCLCTRQGGQCGAVRGKGVETMQAKHRGSTYYILLSILFHTL